jgi:hypothetical protein
MTVVLDVLDTVEGSWSLAAHDLPDLDGPSAVLAGQSANLHSDPLRPPGVQRLTFRDGRPTPYADERFAADTESIWIYLYQPRDVAAMLEFEDRIEPRYADYYANVAAFYAGVFEVDGLGTGYLGEFIAFRRPVGAAREFIRSHEPSPDIVMIEDECRTLQRPDAPGHVLWLSRPGADG